MITTQNINKILGITESFQLHDAVMGVLFDCEKRNGVFEQFLSIESDLSYDWFTNYFQEEQSNRKSFMQDYTPDCICKIISGISNESETVFDECAGIGGLTISVWNEDPDKVFYLEELSDNSVALLLFNLSIRGVNAYVRAGDVLTNTFQKCYRLTRDGRFSNIEECEVTCFAADTVISNPPYSLKFEQAEEYKDDPRFKDFGTPPKSKADYAFILHGLSKLKPSGEMFFILPHGVLFRGQAEGKIRRELIEKNYIDAVIGLPEKLFLNTGIPVCVLVLKKDRQSNDVLFIDASKHFEKGGKQNTMTAEQIRRIVSTYRRREDVEKFAHVATLEEVADNDYNMNIPRYVDTSEPPEPIDLKAAIDDLYQIESEIGGVGRDLSSMMKDLEGPEEWSAERNRLIGIMEKNPHEISRQSKEVHAFLESNRQRFAKRRKVKLYDVATFERSKKDKIYPGGCTLIQVSATRGQMEYMGEPGTVESKNGVIEPKGIRGGYLFQVLGMVMPQFLERYQTGLNINPEIFKHLEFEIHEDEKTQQAVEEIMSGVQNNIESIQREIRDWKDVKKDSLDNMFV